MKKLFLGLPSLFVSCAVHNVDIVKQANRNGSIETTISVIHKDSVDILKTYSKVWYKGNIDKEIIKIDTLKSLGMEVQKIKKETGGRTTKELPKDYEIYITVQ